MSEARKEQTEQNEPTSPYFPPISFAFNCKIWRKENGQLNVRKTSEQNEEKENACFLHNIQFTFFPSSR